MFTILSAKLTAIPGASGWAQVHEFTPEDPAKLSARGRLFGVIATKRIEEASGPEGLRPGGGLDTISSGRELLSRLHEEYFGETEAKPFNALKSAVEKVTAEFKESWGDVEIVAAALVSDVVYSAASGGGKVVISRGGALGTILESSEGSTISASGYPKAGDVMLLATKPFFEKISQGVIKAALGSETPEAAIETFAPMIHESPDSGNLGAVVIKFEEEAPLVTAPAPSSPPRITLSFSERVSGFLNQFLKKLPQRGIYVKPVVREEIPSQGRRLTFSVALILLLVLAVSIGFGVRQKRINDLKGKYGGILAQASSEVDQAISLASVSPERSRELFADSQQKLKQILALKVKDPKIDALRSKIEDSRASILGEFESSPELFLDLTLLSSGFKGDVISASGGSIYVLDKSGRRIVSVAIDTKKSKVVAGPTVISDASDIASYEDRVFILSSDGIYEVTDGDKSKVIEKTWEGNVLIRAFAGNMYVLDKAVSSIYRYQGQGNIFGDKGIWLASGTNASFSGALQWEIDGSIYVLFPNSKILKYSLGSPQEFAIAGVVPEIGSVDAIYTDGDNAGIYLLDRAGKRIVVTDKSGKYVAQYLGDQVADAVSLAVSEANKKIILLTGDKLLSIDIKHLQK